MKKKNNKCPKLAPARAIRYVPVVDLIDLRVQTIIEIILPNVQNTIIIVPKIPIIINCIFSGSVISFASASGVDSHTTVDTVGITSAMSSWLKIILKRYGTAHGY